MCVGRGVLVLTFWLVSFLQIAQVRILSSSTSISVFLSLYLYLSVPIAPVSHHGLS
jgi:hypothetical protein